ncbi:MAG: hypothetical protein WAN65_03760 [Candidatus Sulfotelmatobacter sp.]
MVGVFVDDDVVAVPEPVAAEADVVGSDAKVEAAKPETVGSAAAEVPDVPAPETASEVAVLPGMVEVVVNIVMAGIVANPFAVGVNVRCVGMASLIVEVRCLRGGMRRARRFGTVGGNVRGPATNLPRRWAKAKKLNKKRTASSASSFLIVFL